MKKDDGKKSAGEIVVIILGMIGFIALIYVMVNSFQYRDPNW